MSAPLKSSLPDFFQSAGFSGNNTLLDQLEDFELGGLEDDVVDSPLEDGQRDDDNQFIAGDEDDFSDFNRIADITKSPSRFTGMPFLEQTGNSNVKMNALDMLKIEMGLKNVSMQPNNADIRPQPVEDKAAKLKSLINKTPHNVVMPTNISSSSNLEPNVNFMFPGDTHIPPQLPGMAPYQSAPQPSKLAQQFPHSAPPGFDSKNPQSLAHQPSPSLVAAPFPPGRDVDFGFHMPPAPPMNVPQPPPEPKPFVIPRSQMMNTSDVRFVLTKIIQPLESPDPYADDFYYIQLNLKRNAKAYDDIRKGKTDVVVPTFTAPLPTWKDTKDRIKNQIHDSQRSLDSRTREWEEKEKVLGHQVRSNIARPRELLSVSSLNNQGADGTGNENDTDDFKTMFGTRLWTMRRAVQRGHEALYTVQELEHLLRTPLIWNNVEARQEVLVEIDAAVELLAQAIGLRSIKTLHIIEEGYMGLGYAHGHVDSSADVTIDGALVAALLQSAKGKKLIVRSFGPLPPEKRWMLVPPILTRILQTDHASSNTEERQAEISLIQTCVNSFKQAIVHALSLRSQPVPQMSDVDSANQKEFFVRFVKHLLHHFRQCVKSVLVTFMEKNQLRKVLLIDEVIDVDVSATGDKKKPKNYRLGLFQALIAAGDQLAELLSSEPVALRDTDTSSDSSNMSMATSEDWKQIKDTFLTMIDDTSN